MKTLKKWNEIRQFSKVTLPETKNLKSFNGELKKIEAGTYYITGFWVDMCGLSTKKGDQLNDICIQSKELRAFNEVQ